MTLAEHDNLDAVVAAVQDIHRSIRESVVAAFERGHADFDPTEVVHDGLGDTIYAIDRVSEETLLGEVMRTMADLGPVELIAEGIGSDGIEILPPGARAEDIRWRLLVDPIDGTRGLMFQKRSGWILTGIAPGDATRLRDCVAAVMTEIPLVKQYQSDQLTATRGGGVVATRTDRIAEETVPIVLNPSLSTSLRHGYAQISRFFPGRRDVLGAIDDAVMNALCGDHEEGKALCFEDQYLSTGGQFYELIAGHDRFTADLRPALGVGSLCCHPYDCAALLIAEEAGVLITDLEGAPLDCPLDIHANVGWAGYANSTLREHVEPVLIEAMRAHELLPPLSTTKVKTDGIVADCLFHQDAPIHVARAPGRLDWLGGFGDYSGSLVLQMPLDDAATAAVQLTGDDQIELVSLVDGERLSWTGSWSTLGEPAEVDKLQAALSGGWQAYVVGVAAMLAEWSGRPGVGFRARLTSSVPLGKGVSSSAAIEVATLRALANAQDISLDGETLAMLGQRAENLVVGAPCGIMDQMTSACGVAGRLLSLRCQPAIIEGMFALPDDLEIWGIDSGVRHAISGADYASVRCAAFMGKKMLGLAAGDWLAEVTPSHWAERSAGISDAMLGTEFLAEWGPTDDPLGEVDPVRTYNVRACTEHPILENHRVRHVATLLRANVQGIDHLLGEAMYQAHASYTACGLDCEATDAIVNQVRAAAAAGAKLYGAKITGGGSGGSVAILGSREAYPEVERIASRHAQQFGGGRILGGSSDGTMAVPVSVLTPFA